MLALLPAGALSDLRTFFQSFPSPTLFLHPFHTMPTGVQRTRVFVYFQPPLYVYLSFPLLHLPLRFVEASRLRRRVLSSHLP